jgi:hypothetical protein
MQYDYRAKTLWYAGSSNELHNDKNECIFLPSEGVNAICLFEEYIFVASWDSQIYTIHQGNVQLDCRFLTIPQYPVNCIKSYSQVSSLYALVLKERELIATGSRSGIVCIYEMDK